MIIFKNELDSFVEKIQNSNNPFCCSSKTDGVFYPRLGMKRRQRGFFSGDAGVRSWVSSAALFTNKIKSTVLFVLIPNNKNNIR